MWYRWWCRQLQSYISEVVAVVVVAVTEVLAVVVEDITEIVAVVV
jgi:hypothetical protein